MRAGESPKEYAVPECPGPLRATVRVPGSKSITNRALPMAALARGESRILGALFSEDSLYFTDALRRLGYRLEADEEERRFGMHGAGLDPLVHPEGMDLFIGNSGTSARFLTALVSAGRGRYRIDGVPRMRERPIGDLLSALRGQGVRALDELGTGCPPVRIETEGLSGGAVSVSGEASSQFLSALLIAAPYARRPTEIEVAGRLVSTPYVQITTRMMAAFGIEVEVDEAEGRSFFRVPLGEYRAQEYAVEPDASGASYFFAAAAVCGGEVTVEGLGRDAMQGDARFVEILARMGCDVRYGDRSLTVRGPEDGLRGVSVDLFHMSDLVPTLAAIAPLAKGEVEIRNVANVRFKETDRLRACVAELRKFGVAVEEFADGMRIEPCSKLRDHVAVDTYDDHRMAMAFSVLGLRANGVRIRDPRCVSKTFPDFFDRLESMVAGENGLAGARSLPRS